MIKRVSATDAKNNFGGLLEDVAALGRVDIVRHGRVAAVVLSPRALGSQAPSAERAKPAGSAGQASRWGATHMIPPRLARGARMLTTPDEFDDD
ncbi:MAG: type II toxin-antitoxin system prevent-host-death family antitoxin [Steroidobacteraceae bacterium]